MIRPVAFSVTKMTPELASRTMLVGVINAVVMITGDAAGVANHRSRPGSRTQNER